MTTRPDLATDRAALRRGFTDGASGAMPAIFPDPAAADALAYGIGFCHGVNARLAADYPRFPQQQEPMRLQ